MLRKKALIRLSDYDIEVMAVWIMHHYIVKFYAYDDMKDTDLSSYS